jgi:hypothetical protein
MERATSTEPVRVEHAALSRENFYGLQKRGAS